MSGTVKAVLWCVAGVFLLLPLAAGALPGAVGSALKMNGPAAASLTCSFPINHVCPANSNKLDEQARRQQTTPTTTPPARTPYPPANGAVRPLPSQTPALPAAGEGGGSLPEIGQASGGILGELVKSIPEIGPALEGGLKAIGPAAAP